jgi:hypothetical protein
MKNKPFIKAALVAIILMFGATMASALDPIPQASGFSGFIRPGVGYMSYETNMVASFLGFDLSDESTDSLFDSPDDESTAVFLMPFSLEYTFASSRTQLFFGTDLTDLIRFDYSQQLGVKQDIGSLGLLQGGFLFSGIPAEVWKDPYVVGVKRDETDRDSKGLRLVWDRIWGSQLQLQYTYRDMDIDDEKSGEFLGLSAGDRKLLERSGDRHVAEALYRFNFAQKHWLAPAVIYAIDDLDGDAMANDTVDLQLTYIYRGDPITFTANAFIGWADYDKRNPIYNKTQEDDRYGFNTSVFYKNPWGWSLFGSNPMNFYIEAAYVDVDANIDFYDQQAIFSTIGVLFKW